MIPYLTAGRTGRRPRTAGTAAGSSSATVLHAYANPVVHDVDLQVAQLVQVRDAGWRVVLALPMASRHDLLARAAAAGGVEVKLLSASGRRARRRRARQGSPVARARWLTTAQVAVVHAHDDRAADQWRTVVRRCDVPLVWDVDPAARATPADARRLASSSYLVSRPDATRLAGRRAVPPHRAAALSTPGAWFDLADGGEAAAALPAGSGVTICDVYTCLTGREPAPTTEPVVIDVTSDLAARP